MLCIALAYALHTLCLGRYVWQEDEDINHQREGYNRPLQYKHCFKWIAADTVGAAGHTVETFASELANGESGPLHAHYHLVCGCPDEGARLRGRVGWATGPTGKVSECINLVLIGLWVRRNKGFTFYFIRYSEVRFRLCFRLYLIDYSRVVHIKIYTRSKGFSD